MQYKICGFSLSILLIELCFITFVKSSGYVITTPRRWTSDAESQVCVSFRDASAGGTGLHNLTLAIHSIGIESKAILPPKSLLFAQELGVQCEKVLMPTTKSKVGQISIIGTIGESTINYSKPISISTNVLKTFVQTDKHLYKPSQTVKFRILTVTGPKLQISTEQYDEVYIENPSGTRIRQWLNVANENGLIHLEFQLSEEPEEGTYKIRVMAPDKKLIASNFKVEEYVLPTYKVSIKPPSYVLGTSKEMTFKVCAKYTFGQPVKGKATLTVSNGGWGSYKTTIIKQENISGCHKFILNAEELNINSKNFFAYELSAEAIVIEDGTDVELKAKKASVDISRTALKFEDVSTQKFYKPELTFVGEIKVTNPDDTPAPNEPMKVCVAKNCKNITTNNNGILKFAVPPHLQESNIEVSAVNYGDLRANDSSWRSIMYGSSFTKNLKMYHSASNSSLVIELADEKVQCDPKNAMQLTVPISFSAVEIESARVAVQVISRGQIIHASNDVTEFLPNYETIINDAILISPIKEPVTKNLIRGTFTKIIELSAFASPEAKLIVFYSRPDGEVVSDVRTIDLTECLLNTVNLTWSLKTAQPGAETKLSISAEPQSLCSVGVVDKSVQLLSAKKIDLTVSKLLEVAQRASVKESENRLTNDYEYCKDKVVEEDVPDVPGPPGNPGPPGPPVAVPLVMGRKKRSFYRPYLPYYSDDIDALHMFDDAGVYVFSDLTLEGRVCKRRYEHMVYNYMPMYSESNMVVHYASAAALPTSSSQKERDYFPETWLWDIFVIWDTGESEQILNLPDTITEWVGSAVCVHPTKGVGISETASVTTFKDFFADLTLPASVKRGETFPVKVSVFNYLKTSLPISIVLEESPDYDILADKGTDLGSGERSSCLVAEDKVVHSIRIKPKAFGNINITVAAFIDANSLSTCGTGSGELRTDTLIKPIRVEIEGFEKDKTFTEYYCNGENVPEFKGWDIIPPEDIIPDSARGFISAVGNLMGPTIENLGKLIKMPYGCGEQNMLNFAPNIFVMPYLTKNATKNLAEQAIGYMEKGYQRELNYRHKDGSFSAFGERDDSGSTWLTAFVLKSFAQARNYISIDQNDLRMSQDWLKMKQLENGCFESVGTVLHKGMKGGLSKSSSPSLLTSFVLIALLEAGEDTTVKSVREALFCLKADTEPSDSYSLAVKSYALALAGSPDTKDALTQLSLSAERSPSSMHWLLPDLGSSVEVETAGYAVLALLAHDPVEYFGEASSIIQWMNNQRNGQGGFVSTQDTIVALQAMARVDEKTNKGDLDLTLIASMSPIDPNEVTESKEHMFHINYQNDLLQQKVYFPFVPLRVEFIVDGPGCALIQGVLRYNEPEPEASIAFGLNVTTESTTDKSCKTKRISACVKYLLPDSQSNMGIIEVNLISGFIPLKEDLKKVVGYGTGFFKRYEVDDNLITFYVDRFSTEEVCASFRAKKEIEVEDAKPGSVKVYDYYKPEYYVTEKYTFPTECKTEAEVELPFLSEIIPKDKILDADSNPTGDEDVTTEAVTENFDAMLDAFDEALP